MLGLFAVAAAVAWFLWPQNAASDQQASSHATSVIKVAETRPR